MSSIIIFPNYISHLYFTSYGINVHIISFKKPKGRQVLDWLILKHRIPFVNQSVMVGAMVTGSQVRDATVAPSIPCQYLLSLCVCQSHQEGLVKE